MGRARNVGQEIEQVLRGLFTNGTINPNKDDADTIFERVKQALGPLGVTLRSCCVVVDDGGIVKVNRLSVELSVSVEVKVKSP